MRRSLALIAGACTAVVLAGATAYAMTNDPIEAQPVGSAGLGRAEAPLDAGAAPADAPAAAGKAAAPREKGIGPVIDAVGRQQVGALESVDSLLDYRSEGATQTFSYPGAEYVKVHFAELTMLPGDYVTVADPARTEVHRIDSDPLDVVGGLLGSRAEADGDGAVAGAGRWAMSVTGDTAVVTLHRAVPDPLGVQEVAGLGVRVDKVARGFTDTEQEAADAGDRALTENGREESVCGRNEARDAVCYKSADPAAYKKSKAVARLLINGTELCTGWRLGTTNRMLTNNHCMVTSGDAYDTEVWFDYQCTKCGGHAVFKATKVWGDKVLSTNRDLDYTLFTVENFAQVQKFGYLTIEPARPTRGSEVYIPQHPGGDPGMIAMGSDKDSGGICAVNDPAYDGYTTDSDVSYYCDTAGGSSGSPVISRKTDRVIALHHFGGCPNSGVRIDLIYNRIKKLL